MNLFKQRRNKSFNYTPRHQTEQEQNPKEELASKWEEIRGTSKRKSTFFSSLPLMVLFLIAVLVLLYILSRY
ncbi:hypothetical protein [Lacinutrix cladophorae]